MRIVFFGTSGFAVASLARLNEHHEIKLVITRPDKPKGRHLLTQPSPVKVKAQELNLPVFCLEDIPESSAIEKLKRCDADLFIVIAYGRILSSAILSIPKFYSIGLHASLLPKYKGASPINWAILNGETETGVTVFKLNEKMDAGEIIMQKGAVILDSDNALTLTSKLSGIGADLLLKALGAIEKGEAQFIGQNEKEATFTPKLTKEAGLIDWKKSAFYVHNQVRAMSGWPGAFSRLNGQRIKIWETEVIGPPDDKFKKPGEVIKIEKDGISVSCGEGAIKIKEIQAQAGKRLKVSDYLPGHKVSAGDFFL